MVKVFISDRLQLSTTVCKPVHRLQNSSLQWSVQQVLICHCLMQLECTNETSQFKVRSALDFSYDLVSIDPHHRQ